ncbi:hypothetical protein CNEONATNEC26_01111 [Clostridium neonatale]|nr:hypothetical protein CNEONATNEC26_01111 [Clostridium neonatale]
MNIPANIDPPAIPAVTVDAIPEKSNAIANIIAAEFPSSGFNNSCACSSSVTEILFLKNVIDKSTIALFIINPIIIDNNVSINSYFNCLSIIDLS